MIFKEDKNMLCVVCGDKIEDANVGIKRINVKIEFGEKPVIGPVRGIGIGEENYRVCKKCGNLLAISYMLSNIEHVKDRVSLTFEEDK